MTIQDMEALFEKYRGIRKTDGGRPDLIAFNLLDKLVPGTRDIISAAEHDQFYLDVSVEALAEVATEEDIRTLAHYYPRDRDDHTRKSREVKRGEI